MLWTVSGKLFLLFLSNSIRAMIGQFYGPHSTARHFSSPFDLNCFSFLQSERYNKLLNDLVSSVRTVIN